MAETRIDSRVARLAYFVSHPIQYQAPLLRRIAREPDIELSVFFSSDHTTRGFIDEGFGVKVEWDVPLLEGYSYKFLPRVPGPEGLGFARPINRRIFETIEQGGFDAVWVHGYSTVNSLRTILSAGMLDVPVLLRAESTLQDRERSSAKLFAKDVFFHVLRRHVRGVLAIGTANAKYWRRYMGDDMPLYAMPYAVDNEFFERKALEASSRTEALRRELGLVPGRPVILFASKLQARKHCDDLIAAWDEAWKQTGSVSRPYLLIIGDGEQRAALEASAAGLEGIQFLGFKNQTELPAYFNLCDVFVLPSIHEPWGLVVNEAMNAARAVIVSDDVGCQADLVVDGVNGRVYPARNVSALTEALRDVLDTPGRAQAMGTAGLLQIRRHGFEEDVAGLRQALADVVPGFQR
jgi:glycosyltransferase involved in cell wall biosynthesis